jgi:hypothetical protein
MISSETGTLVCRKCGETVSGSFCSACGARLAASRKVALEDVPVIGEPVDFVRAFWRTTRAPVTEPLRVAALTGDKSPYKFFIAGAGMFIGFFLAMQALAKAWGVAGFTREQNQFLSVAKYAIFIHLAVAAAVVYVAFALVAGRKVSVGSHARLWALLGGYYLTAETILLVTAVAICIAIFLLAPAFTQATISIFSIALAPAVFGLLLLLLINLVVAQARQWAKPLWMSAAIFALALIATHLISPPLQSALLSAIDGAAANIGMTTLSGVPQ